jgi:hypothetical protein
MYCGGVNPVRALVRDPALAWHFFVTAAVRALYFKVRKKKLLLNPYAGKRVLDAQRANEILTGAILRGAPYMFGRYGSSELDCTTKYLLAEKGIVKRIRVDLLRTACLHNGLFPLTEDTIARFGRLMLDASAQVDLVGTFRMIMEDYYIRHYMRPDVVLSYLSMMNFWRYEVPFTAALRGKTVLVVHPFTETIRRQYEKRAVLFERPEVLPEFRLRTVKAVQTVAGERDNRFTDWFEALDYMYGEAMRTDFDVALVGCGAYGFPLAARLKQAGKIAIHMGGITQMLFGIKGKRWDLDPESRRLYNEHWVRPDPDEMPRNAQAVEDGCYW